MPAHPFRRAAAHDVAREGGEDVAVAQHEVAGAQQRHQLPLVAVGEIRRVNEAEGGGREQFALLAFAGGGLDELGGIPFAEIDFQALHFEPAFEQINLRGLARAIQALDRDQPAGKIQFGERFHSTVEETKSGRAENNLFQRNSDGHHGKQYILEGSREGNEGRIRRLLKLISRFLCSLRGFFARPVLCYQIQIQAGCGQIFP